MTFLGFYVLFALTTAIVAIYELLVPVLRDMIANDEGAELARNPLLYFIHFCVSLLIAPVVFLSVIIPRFGDSYRNGLYNGLTGKEEKI